MSDAEVRPVMVTVLGWIWVAVGGFMTLTSLLVATMAFGYRDLMKPMSTGGIDLPGFAVMDWVLSHFQGLSVLQLGMSGCVLVAGFQLLQLRGWARTFLEVFCWLGIAYLLVFGVWFGFVWVSMTQGIEAGAPEAPPIGLIKGFGVVGSLMAVLFNGAPVAALLWLLRHPTVRRAVR